MVFFYIKLELLIDSFKITLQWVRHFIKMTLGWSSIITIATKLPTKLDRSRDKDGLHGGLFYTSIQHPYNISY
jgi:hypothetical protein